MVRVGNGPEAERLFRQSLAIRERLAAADPGSADAQPDFRVSFQRLGDLLTSIGNTAEATHRDHLAWLERGLDLDDPAIRAVRAKLDGLDRGGQ